MSNVPGITQCAVSTNENVVMIELICHDNYMAEVLTDDLVSRLKTDGKLSLTLTVGDVLEESDL